MAPSSDPWYGQGFKLLKGFSEHTGISFIIYREIELYVSELKM